MSTDADPPTSSNEEPKLAGTGSASEGPEPTAPTALQEPPPPLRDALSQALRRVLFRGRQEIDRAATVSRSRLELRQLERDRTHFWTRLGKEAYHLVQAGEIEHPALRRAMNRIDELESRIREVRDAAPVESLADTGDGG